MNIKELSQLGLAYSMRSRAGVTVALKRVADKLEKPIDFSVMETIDDEAFWLLIQSTMDRIMAAADTIIRQKLEDVRNA